VGKIDYGWIVVGVIVIAVIVLWKPITGFISGVSSEVTNKEGYERGKAVFYDTVMWGGEDSYKSCAMCHATDFVPDPDKKIEMQDYVAGKPHILKDIGGKYRAGMLSSTDELFEQVMTCLTLPTRMACGRVSINAPYMPDLLEYVRRQ
jgi:hypothetical protein